MLTNINININKFFEKTVSAASSYFISFRVVFAISLLCITSTKDPSFIELKIDTMRMVHMLHQRNLLDPCNYVIGATA